jgi:hypothetical protein
MKMYNFGNCKVLPGPDGSCAQGYSLFKTKNGICCRGIPYHDIGCPIYGTKRRFMSPISKKCVTLRGKKVALAKLNKLRTGIVAPMSGDEDLGSYATEAGIQFFGVKKRKHCDRRKKSCYRKKPSLFKKSKAPCGGMKRKTCRSTVGCSYVKKRGCRNRKNAAILVAGAVAGVEEAVSAVPDVANAVEKTSNRAERLAIEAGAKPVEAAQVGVIAAGAQAVEEAKSVGVPKESLALVRQTAEQRAAANRAAYDALPADSMERLDFGRRRSRFGNVCKTLKDIESCVNYRDSSNMFPCNWSDGANKWCSRRRNPITYNQVMKGMYADIIKSVVTPPVAPVATATAPSVSQKRVTEVCRGLDQVTCGQFGMCQWVNGETHKRCQAGRGYGRKNWEGKLPGAPARTAAEIAAEEARELMFGGLNISELAKLAKKVKLQSAEKLKKLKSKVEKHANTLEQSYDKLNEIVNGKESDMDVQASFGGLNISKLAKLAKKVKLPSAEKLKKLKSKVEKHANTLEQSYDKLNEIVNGKESDMDVQASFGGLNISKLAKLAKKLKGKFPKNININTGEIDKPNEGEAEKLTTAFGKKHSSITYKKSSKKGSLKKLPTKIRKLCHKLKIKITRKVGSRRVCKKLNILKKQIARKLSKLKKAEKVRRRHASR